LSYPFCFLHAEDVTKARINLAQVRLFYPCGVKSITFEFDVDHEVDIDYPTEGERDAAFEQLVRGIDR
jgi:hypothetical protein